jgi:glycosyltransferase involved in cell wall biosynthesis
MRIAWFTPYGPHSAIGHYSQAVVEELAKVDQVVVYASDDPRAVGSRGPRVVQLGARSDASVLRELADCDAAFYNMGDYSPYHKRIYEVLLQHPGVVVLHDLVMRNFFNGYHMLGRHDPEGLIRRLAYSEGTAAAPLVRAVIEHWRLPTDDPNILMLPMFKAVLHRCLGVVVHSHYSRGRVAAATIAPVEKLDFPLFGPSAARPAPVARPRRPGRVRLLTIGHVNPNKQIHTVIECIAASDFLRRHAEYLVVGQPDEPYVGQLRQIIDRRRLAAAVRLVGRVSDDALWRLLVQADVVINLRNPHLGESSASLLDALLAAAPVVVWNHGYYCEFPDDVVCKISSPAELTRALERLCGDRELRKRIGAEARRHALSRFNTAAFCKRLRAFAQTVRSVRPALALTDLLSDRLLELGTRRPRGLPERLAAEVAALTAAPACKARESADAPHWSARLVAA